MLLSAGMPSDAAGPVSETMTPTLTSACAVLPISAAASDGDDGRARCARERMKSGMAQALER